MRRSCRHLAAGFLSLIFAVILYSVSANAQTVIYDGRAGNDIEKAWEEMLTSLPDEIRREAEAYTPTDENDRIQEFFSISYWGRKLLSYCRSAFEKNTAEVASIFGMLLLSAVIRQWTGTGTTENCFQFCSDVCVAVAVFTVFSRLMTRIQTFLGQLCNVMTAMIPVMAAVQYGMGEVAAASVNHISLTMFITILNQLQRWLFLPLGQALCCISILSAVCTQIPLGGFTGGVRKLFTTLFSFMILIYSFIYGMQNLLAGSADSLGMRTIKFAMGNFIPVVGGTVAEAFSAVRVGMGYVKAAAGAGGIWIVCLLFLPMALDVWCMSLILSLNHTVAELLCCTQSAKLLAETKSILQLFSAILWLSAVFFLFAIILFTKSAGRVP